MAGPRKGLPTNRLVPDLKYYAAKMKLTSSRAKRAHRSAEYGARLAVGRWIGRTGEPLEGVLVVGGGAAYVAPIAAVIPARKRPHFAGYSSETRNRRFASDCVVADALRIEPVSAAKFPVKRESAGNFCNLQGIWP